MHWGFYDQMGTDVLVNMRGTEIIIVDGDVIYRDGAFR